MRKIILILVLLCLVVAPSGAQPPPFTKSTISGTIRNVRIVVRDVFEGDDLSWFYQGANSLKVNTKEQTIRQELVFKEGDEYSDVVIRESERNLRTLPFLRFVTIVPKQEGPFVDITVSVQDSWTLIPFMSFSMTAGSDKQSAGIAEGNILGYGKRLEALYANDENRETIATAYEDRRLGGTRQALAVGGLLRSDGYDSNLFYGKPFRTLVDPYAWNADFSAQDLVGKLFQDGTEDYIFRQDKVLLNAGFTIAHGTPEKKIYRYTAGWDFIDFNFKQADEADYEDVDLDPDEVSNAASGVPTDRRFNGPSFALQWVEPDFVSSNYLDRFERIQDFNLGAETLAKFTIAPRALSSNEDTLLFTVSQADGWRFSKGPHFLRAKAGIMSRAADSGFENTLATFDMRYYKVTGPQYVWGQFIGRHTLVGSLSVDIGDDFDRDRQLVLGAVEGLRGYKANAFTGDNSVLLNLEDRAFFAEDMFKLISIGSAVFADVGGVSESSIGDAVKSRLYGDVGFGLRLGFGRSSGGSVVRIDVAFPVRDGDDGTDAWSPRLVFSTGQSLTAGLPGESAQNQGSNVKVNFLP